MRRTATLSSWWGGVASVALGLMLSAAPASAQDTSNRVVHLFFVPESREAVAGELQRSDLWIDTGSQTINAIDLRVQLNGPMSLVNAEHTDSFINLWVREPSVNASTVSFTGGSITPFSGKGVIGQIYWQATQSGTVTVALTADSAVTLADGQGTKTPLDLRPTTYQAVGAEGVPVVSSDSHPDPNTWYALPVVRLNWSPQASAAYSYVVTRNPDEVPDDTPDTPVGAVQLSPLGDGIYYFRIREHTQKGWSTTATRQFKIDITPPDAFTVSVNRDQRLFNGKPFASFVATDVTSGVVSYEVQEGDRPVMTVSAGPYIYQGTDTSVALRVTAIDRAGNRQTVTKSASRPTTLILILTAIVILLLVLGLWWRKHRRR